MNARTLTLAVCLVLVAGAAHAQADPQQAFERAQAHFAAKNCAEALPLFEQALASTKSPNARLYVARCLAMLGRLPEAYAEMRLTRDEAASRASAEPRFTETRDAATKELDELAARVGRVRFALVQAPPSDLVIRLDGAVIEPSRWGREIAVMPGPVHVEAAAAEHDGLDLRVEVGAGSALEVPVVLQRKPAVLAPPPPPLPPAPLPPPPPAPAEPPSGPPAAMLASGVAVATVGVAGMITFAVAGATADARFEEIFDACGGVRCTDTSLNDDIESGQRLDTVANVAVAIGGAGLLAGTTLILVAVTQEF